MPDMNQPNLQAILSDYGSNRANAYKKLEQAAYNEEAEKLKAEAIDAIYAGLLAVIQTKTTLPTSEVGPTKNEVRAIVNSIREQQAVALKRWCYGDDNA